MPTVEECFVAFHHAENEERVLGARGVRVLDPSENTLISASSQTIEGVAAVRTLCLASRPAPGAPGGQDALLERAFKAIDTLMATLTDKQAGGLRGKDVVETADAIRNYFAPPAAPYSEPTTTEMMAEYARGMSDADVPGSIPSERHRAAMERVRAFVLNRAPDAEYLNKYAEAVLAASVKESSINWRVECARICAPLEAAGMPTTASMEERIGWIKDRLRAPPAAPAIDESAWLIEGPGPLFWTAQVERGCVPWTTHTKAVRFARREDAECVRRAMGLTFAKVTEHVWISADAARACDPNPAPAIDVEAVSRAIDAAIGESMVDRMGKGDAPRDERSRREVIEHTLRTALSTAAPKAIDVERLVNFVTSYIDNRFAQVPHPGEDTNPIRVTRAAAEQAVRDFFDPAQGAKSALARAQETKQ